MPIPSYLTISRHHIFYFRWPIPKALHPFGKSSEVKVSLKTRDQGAALQLSRLLSYLAYQLLNDASGGGMRYDEIKSLLKSHFTQLLIQHKEAIAIHRIPD